MDFFRTTMDQSSSYLKMFGATPLGAGSTFTICVNMYDQKFSEKGPFSEGGSDLSRSEERVIFLEDLDNKVKVRVHFGIFSQNKMPHGSTTLSTLNKNS